MRLVMTMGSGALFRRVVVATAVLLLAVGAAGAGVAHAHGGGDSRLPLADLSIDSEYFRDRNSPDDFWQIIVENNTVGNHPGFGFRRVQVEIVYTLATGAGATITTTRDISDLPSGGSQEILFTEDSLPRVGRNGAVRVEARIVGTSPEESPGFQSNNVTEELWFTTSNGPYSYSYGDTGVGVRISDRFPQAEGATTFTVEADHLVESDYHFDYLGRVDSIQFDVQVKITLSRGLAFAGTPQTPSGTAFDPDTGIWDVGAMYTATRAVNRRVSRDFLKLPVPVTLSGDSLADLPLTERCLTAEVVRAEPWFASDPSKRKNDIAIACLGDYSRVLENSKVFLTSGEITLFYPYDCVGVTVYPCSSEDTVEIMAQARLSEISPAGSRHSGVNATVWLRPEEITVHVPVREGRLYDGLTTSVTDASTASWHTGRDERRGGPYSVEGVKIKYTRAGFNAQIEDWSNLVRTVTVSGLNGAAAPGRVRIRLDSPTGFLFYDPNPTHRRTPFSLNTASTAVSSYFLEFSTLGTYVVEFKVDAVRSDSAMTTYTGAGAYTFHVGPVAELELQGAWDAPGVFTLTALNHGPDAAPAARVTVTPPPELRFARAEASQGTYRNGVWDIGELEIPKHRVGQALPKGPTLTVYTEPAANTGTPDQMVTASIENTQDYCVRIKTGDTDHHNDLECVWALPDGYTEHSASYYDYRPDNNEVALPADWTAVQLVAATRLTGIAITSEAGYLAGDDIEVTATFNKPVTVAGQPRLRMRVGDITREAALHSHSRDKIVFRYRVREGDSDTVDGVSIPPGPFVLPQGASISGPGGGRVSLFFAGLEDQSGHRVYPKIDRVEGTNILVWSPPESLYTGVDGARYRLFDGMRHYYRWNETTRRWEIEFRIADAGLDAPDQDLVQWLVLRASGYYIGGAPHIYGAAPVEMKPWLGGWENDQQHQQQVCVGLKAEFSPGKTREQRLEELRNVEIAWISHVGFGEYGVLQRQSLYNLLWTAQQKAAEEPCPDPPTPPTGAVTIQGQASTRSAFGQSEGPVTGRGQQTSPQRQASPQQQPASQTVPADSPLVPEGIEPGDSFRLLFVTSTTTGAASSDIADYNGFVQARAAANAYLAGFSGQFTAYISTSAVSARDNTGTTGEGVPVHWLGGEKVADDYADLYDGDWDSVSGTTEGGGSYTGLVWTGGNSQGEKSGQRYAGAAEVRMGDLGDAALAASSPTAKASSEAYPLYALSPVITVAEAAGQLQVAPPQQQQAAVITGLALGSTGPYGAGDAISVGVAFSRDVTVAGAPELSIEVGGERRTAVYDDAAGGPAVLVFSYTVREGDSDGDGVSVYPGSIALPAGASITDSGGNDAELVQPGLAPQPGHTVDAPADTTPPAIVSGPVVVSDPDAAEPDDDTYAGDDVIRVALTFSEAVTVSGEPRLRLRIGERNRWARYDRSEQDGARLVFAYAVKGSDRDEDGVSVESDQLRLNGGSIADARGNAAVLSHPALADQAGHRVDGSLEGQPAQPQAPDKKVEPAAGDQSQATSTEAGVQSQATSTVAADSPLAPAGMAPGDRFRLLFVTSATTTAESYDIADYNALARAAAGGNEALRPFGDGFTALISTAAVDARDNTGTNGDGAPIYWLGGDKVADDYADLYDGDWDSAAGRTETGSGYTGLVWTGGNSAGDRSGQRYAGAAEVRLGDLGDVTLALSSPAAGASGEAYPIYALSPVLRVAAAPE